MTHRGSRYSIVKEAFSYNLVDNVKDVVDIWHAPSVVPWSKQLATAGFSHLGFPEIVLSSNSLFIAKPKAMQRRELESIAVELNAVEHVTSMSEIPTGGASSPHHGGANWFRHLMWIRE